MTEAQLKEVSSLAGLSLSAWTPTSDKTKLPELRHNLRLIVDVTKADVEGLAREGKSVNEKRRWALREEQLAKQRISETEKSEYSSDAVLTLDVSRLTQIQTIVTGISQLTLAAATAKPSLAPLEDSFRSLLAFKVEYKDFDLDDAVVGAIGQTVSVKLSRADVSSNLSSSNGNLSISRLTSF